MTNWIYLVVFFIIAYVILTPGDDDDDRDGGMMVPAYQRTEGWLVHLSFFYVLYIWSTNLTQTSMALYSNTDNDIQAVEKKTSQGTSKRTKLSATSSRPKKKRYRGQGRKWAST